MRSHPLPDSPVKRMAIAFMGFLREAGWVVDDEDMNDEHIGPIVPFWRGPGRCEPVFWRAQFDGLYEIQNKGDRSDIIGIWTVMKGMSGNFRFSDPELFENVVVFLHEKEGRYVAQDLSSQEIGGSDASQ